MLRFEIRNTLIEIRTSFFLTVALMLILCENETVIISLASSVFHEFGHLSALMIFGEKADRLLFSASGLRIDRKSRSSLSFGKEVFVALAGVTVNFMICIFSYALYRFFNIKTAASICAVNTVIAVFNLLPIESLDGATALGFWLSRRISEEKVSKILIYISLLTETALVVFFVFTVYMGEVNPSFAVVTLYLMIILLNHIFELKKSKL